MDYLTAEKLVAMSVETVDRLAAYLVPILEFSLAELADYLALMSVLMVDY